MKIGIMQPYFLPYIGYWQLLNVVDKYIIYDDVNYIKNGWINRNKILCGNNSQWLTMKLDKASSNKLINEIEIIKDEINIKKMLKTIEQVYKKAPYFNEVYKILQEILMFQETNLAKFLENSIRVICKYLEIETEIILSSSLEKNNNLKAEEKVIEICKILQATEYYNAIGGQQLYSYQNFNFNKIKLKFLKTEEIRYKQFKNEFINNLSIVDIMMFNSKEKLKEYLNFYTLIKSS